MLGRHAARHQACRAGVGDAVDGGRRVTHHRVAIVAGKVVVGLPVVGVVVGETCPAGVLVVSHLVVGHTQGSYRVLSAAEVRRDGDRCGHVAINLVQFGAALEGIVFDRRHRAGDAYVGECCHVPEAVEANALHPIGDGYCGDFVVCVESVSAEGGHRGGDIILGVSVFSGRVVHQRGLCLVEEDAVRNGEIGVRRVDGEGRDAGAIGNSGGTPRGDFVDVHRRERGAAAECIGVHGNRFVAEVRALKAGAFIVLRLLRFLSFLFCL